MKKQEIKVGDRVLIKDNLMEELVRIGFDEKEMGSFVERFKGKTETVLDVYQDADIEISGVKIEGTNEWFVTVELCCEIPINACQIV